MGAVTSIASVIIRRKVTMTTMTITTATERPPDREGTRRSSQRRVEESFVRCQKSVAGTPSGCVNME